MCHHSDVICDTFSSEIHLFNDCCIPKTFQMKMCMELKWYFVMEYENRKWSICWWFQLKVNESVSSNPNGFLEIGCSSIENWWHWHGVVAVRGLWPHSAHPRSVIYKSCDTPGLTAIMAINGQVPRLRLIRRAETENTGQGRLWADDLQRDTPIKDS